MQARLWVTSAAIAIFGSVASAQDASNLTIDGAPMVTEVAAPSHMEYVDTIYSGWNRHCGARNDYCF